MDQFASPHDPGDPVSTEDSARNRAEAELRLKQSAIDYSSDPIYWVKADGRIAYANRAACRSLGYCLEELLSMWVSDFDPDFPREAWPAHWKKMKESGTITFESHHRSKEGRVFPVEVTTNYLEHEGQEYIWAHARDITERKRAEEALRESEERYRAVAEDTPVLICRFLPGGEITYVNQAYCKCFEKSAGELVGHSFLSMLPEADRKTVMDAIAALTVDSPTQSLEHRVIAPGGELQWQRWTCRALFDDMGRSVAYQSVGEDITDRKWAETLQIEQQHILELISKSHTSLTGIFEAIIRFTENQFADVRATVLFVDHNKLQHGAAPSMPASYNERIDGLEIGPNAGSCGTAAYRRERVIVAEVDSDPLWGDFRELAAEHGFSACWSEPVFAAGGEVTATFALYRREPGVPTASEIQLIEAMSNLVSIAIERKRAEEATQEKQKQLDNLLSNVGVIVLEGDPFDFYYVGGQVERILGYPRELWFEDPGGPLGFWSKHLHPDDTDKIEICRRAIQLGENHAFEYRMIAADGREVWFYDTVTVETVDGVPVKTRSVLVDITDRKRAEAARRASDEQVRLLLDSTAEAICGLDLDGNCTWCNPACLRMLGYESSDQVLGKNMHALIHHTHSDGSPYAMEQCRIFEAFRQGKDIHVDDEVLWRADGTCFAAEYWSYPIRRDGEVVGSVVTFLDITERKQLAEQLRQAQKMEAVGQLAAGVAHDFNNLLTVILCNSEMLLSALAEKSAAPSDELLPSGLKLIQAAGKQAASLTRQLLTFGRRETAKPEVLDPKKAVGDMEEMLRRLIGEHIQLDLRLKEGTWFILAVPGQIEQIIMNLALNAAYAMPEGGCVEIRVENAELDGAPVADHTDAKSGPHVMLSVADTGTGMTPETLEHIFEPFFTTKPVGKGTGLGLATVYGVAKQLGGHIRVDSKLGVGSTLRIYMPVAKKKQAKREDENRSDSSGWGGHPVPQKAGSGARSPLSDAP